LRLRFHATVGRYDDGRVAEVFITNHKAGSMAGHSGERLRGTVLDRPAAM
jgi:hypothetical protein